MTNVIGLDLSVTRIGYADTWGATFSVTSRHGPDDPIRRLDDLARRATGAAAGVDIAAVEGYSLNSPGRLSLVRLGELGGIIRHLLWTLDVAVYDIPPASLKRYATGNGNATKEAMVAAARAMGGDPANHDEADAFLLRQMVRDGLGLDGRTLEAHQVDAIRNVPGVVW